MPMQTNPKDVCLRDSRLYRLEVAFYCQCFVQVINFILFLLFVVYFVQAGTVVKVYLDSADVTPSRFGGMVNQTFDIIRNVDEISENVVPISDEAKKSIVNGTSNTALGDAMSNSYKSFTEVSRMDWKNLITNFTTVLASVARVNHTKITNLIGDLHSEEMQTAIKTRVDKTLYTVDSAGHNVFDIFKTLKRAMTYNVSDEL